MQTHFLLLLLPHFRKFIYFHFGFFFSIAFCLFRARAEIKHYTKAVVLFKIGNFALYPPCGEAYYTRLTYKQTTKWHFVQNQRRARKHESIEGEENRKNMHNASVMWLECLLREICI